VWHEPPSECDIDAYSAMINSDIIIIGPGDLFTSVVTNLLVKNVNEAIANSGAKKVYICNLMTKPGETAGFDAYRHIREVIRYLGSDLLDYIVVSNTRLSSTAIREYAKKDQEPVRFGDLGKIKKLTRAKVLLADVSHEKELVRHDSEKIKNEILDIVNRECRRRRR
jgi:uncharacterized cofD-like protein